jgi:hypothetical protein
MISECNGITAHENDIYENYYGGINVSTPGQDDVDATRNWWGSDTGPYHPGSNPLGEGNNVTDHVIYDPWVGNNPGEKHKPKITSMYPDVNSIHMGTVSHIEIWAEDIDGDETIEYVEIAIKNETWNSTWIRLDYNGAPETPRWEYFWDTTQVADVPYIIQARAFDGELNSTTVDYMSRPRTLRP